MHESTNRFLCRVAFLLACVVPTFGTLSWIMYRQSQWSVEVVADELSQTLGMKCQLDRFYNPAPNKWIFENVRFKRAGEDAISFPVLKAERIDRTWHLAADQVSIDWESRQRLWETLQEAILLDRTGGYALELTIQEVHFSGEQIPSLSHLSVSHKPNDRRVLTSSAQVANGQEEGSLHVALDAEKDSPWKVQIETNRLATDHMAIVVPGLSNLGERAYFQGRMIFELSEVSPRTEVHGALINVDLASSLKRKFGLYGAGDANLHLDEVIVQNDTLRVAKGGIIARNGQVSRRLIQRAAKHLFLVTPPPSQYEDLVAFQEMVVGFDFLDGHIVLKGMCNNMPPGTIMAGEAQPLVYGNPENKLPATNLVSVFHEEHATSVPASQASVSMARWLAIPRAIDPSGSQLR